MNENQIDAIQPEDGEEQTNGIWDDTRPGITVYQSDEHGVYVGETTADQSPLDPDGVYMIPGGCVTFPPVGTLAVHEAFQLNGPVSTATAWNVVPDYRGVTYWLPSGVTAVQENVGPLPVGATLTAPPPPPLTEAEQRTLAANEKTSRVAEATLQISILTDATDPDIVDEVDPADVALLVLWKKYRVDVNKIKPATDALPITWPNKPGAA